MAKIGLQEIEILELEMDVGGVKLQSQILEKINQFPNKLIDKKQVRSFLRILNYASDFIENLAEIRKPFQKLLRKDQMFDFSPYSITL